MAMEELRKPIKRKFASAKERIKATVRGESYPRFTCAEVYTVIEKGSTEDMLAVLPFLFDVEMYNVELLKTDCYDDILDRFSKVDNPEIKDILSGLLRDEKPLTQREDLKFESVPSWL